MREKERFEVSSLWLTPESLKQQSRGNLESGTLRAEAGKPWCTSV
jgi:hypothetical protein